MDFSGLRVGQVAQVREALFAPLLMFPQQYLFISAIILLVDQ